MHSIGPGHFYYLLYRPFSSTESMRFLLIIFVRWDWAVKQTAPRATIYRILYCLGAIFDEDKHLMNAPSWGWFDSAAQAFSDAFLPPLSAITRRAMREPQKAGANRNRHQNKPKSRYWFSIALFSRLATRASHTGNALPLFTQDTITYPTSAVRAGVDEIPAYASVLGRHCHCILYIMSIGYQLYIIS